MNDEQSSLSNLDNKLFQLVAQTRKLFQTKNGIYEQIKVCRADIDNTKSFIETTSRNINKLEEEIPVKQNTVIHNKATVKSMKASHSQLLQYEKTLKAELERREASYNQDVEVYDERIANYWKVFQEHKDYYHQRPLAGKLLTLQAENEAIECRINACEDQIAIKQKELDGLVGQTVISSSTEKPPDRYPSEDPHCDSGELTITAPEKQLDHQTEISSLNLAQIKISQDGHKTSGEANAEEVEENSKAQDTPSYAAAPEETSHELFSHPRLYEQKQQSDKMAFEDQDQESTPEEQEEAAIISDTDEAVEEEMEDGVAVEEEQAPLSTDEEDNKGHGALPQSSSRASPPSSPAGVKDLFSTPTFSLGCSPSSSPSKGTSEVKSPASLFSMNSGRSPTGFSRFGFDIGSSQEEESPFTFASSYFSDKQTSESQSPSGTGFLFEQTDKCEDFQFSFASKSPQTSTADQDKTSSDDFPFSFNFGKF